LHNRSFDAQRRPKERCARNEREWLGAFRVAIRLAEPHVVDGQASQKTVARHRKGAPLGPHRIEPAGKLARSVLGQQEERDET
jgi:hypothetical protein